MGIRKTSLIGPPDTCDWYSVQAFARSCQIAAGVFLEPTDSLRVFASVHDSFDACPERLAGIQMAAVATALVRLARETLAWGDARWGRSIDDGSVRTCRDRVAQALDCVLALHDQPSLSLRAIAARLGVGEAHLSHVMNEISNRGYSDHLHAARLLHAIVALADGAETIRAIAQRCGYRQPAHLNHQFRSVLHTTPTRFRQLAYAERLRCKSS